MDGDFPHTLALKVAYNGAPFSGFARQPDQLTVQGELENALEIALRRPVVTTCAGRTDAGVHALGQVVSFDISTEESDQIDHRKLKRSLNAITHEAIAINEINQVKDGFSARFDARAREYRYFLATGDVPPIFMRDFAWFVPGTARGLDLDAMTRASRCLIGEHDFKSFCKAASAEGKPTCRTLLELSFREERALGEPVIVARVVGSSFLHSMVRTLVGTLVDVGKGLRAEASIADVLEARDRTAAGECAPAQGLVFWNVRYE